VRDPPTEPGRGSISVVEVNGVHVARRGGEPFHILGTDRPRERGTLAYVETHGILPTAASRDSPPYVLFPYDSVGT
jgi:hypothetical protein